MSVFSVKAWEIRKDSERIVYLKVQFIIEKLNITRRIFSITKTDKYFH